MVTLKDLLEAGVHFGHQTKRWNPKMKKFIFEERNGVYIINLIITLEQVKEACRAIEEIAASGKPILFVGTKKQAKDIIPEIAVPQDIFYVTERWLGGTLTNQMTIRQSVNRLKELETLQSDGTMEKLSKKEAAMLKREMLKLQKNLNGIKEMNQLPGALFIVDPKKEKIAVQEANRLHIPIIAILDTNCDPDVVQYPIAGNDDSIRSIKLIATCLAEACTQGFGRYQQIIDKLKKEQAEAESKKAKDPIRREAGAQDTKFKKSKKPFTKEAAVKESDTQEASGETH